MQCAADEETLPSSWVTYAVRTLYDNGTKRDFEGENKRYSNTLFLIAIQD